MLRREFEANLIWGRGGGEEQASWEALGLSAPIKRANATMASLHSPQKPRLSPCVKRVIANSVATWPLRSDSNMQALKNIISLCLINHFTCYYPVPATMLVRTPFLLLCSIIYNRRNGVTSTAYIWCHQSQGNSALACVSAPMQLLSYAFTLISHNKCDELHQNGTGGSTVTTHIHIQTFTTHSGFTSPIKYSKEGGKRRVQ
jgi:hypothetical protein